MEKVTRTKINEAGVEVFSTMYFMPIQLLAELPAEDVWRLDSTYITAEIRYSGMLHAAVTFYFPARMVTSIVENFLGVDPDEITEQQMLDTMKEAANMVIGCFLGKADPEGATKLGIPKASLLQDFSPANIGADAEILVFTSEYGFLWMSYVEHG